MAVKIDGERCVGCSQCVAVCPVEALKGWGEVSVDEDLCTDCWICIDYCPLEALEVATS